MANPTTNYGWPMPTSADLVTDLPADFALFGQPVDTSLKALNPETTLGDISYRSATSNTNTRLGIGTNGQVLAVSGGVPAWTTTSDVTPLTTKGDLFTFDTADARLAVGTNGQTLVADSTAATGLKWATPSSGSTFSGASIYRSTDLTLTATASTTFTWDSESYDTDAYHSTSTNTDRFTIPTGKSGKFLLLCNAFVGTQSSSLEGYYMKNGTDIRRFDITTSPTKTLTAHTILDLVAGDYLIFRIYNAAASSANCATGGGNLTQWSITYLGA